MIVDFTFAGTPFYSPPKRAVVNFTWATLQAEFKFPGAPYSPPQGNSIAFSWQAGPHPNGFIATVWGGNAVLLDTLKARPAGFVSTLWGATDLDWQQWITPGGKPHMLFGTTKAYNLKQIVTATGTKFSAFGTTKAYNLWQYAYPTGTKFGAFGTTKAYNLTQIVRPTGTKFGTFGTAKADMLLQFLRPGGFIDNAFGAPTSYNLRQQVHAVGAIATAFGLQLTYNLKRYVNVGGAKQTAFGTQFIQLMSIRPTGWRLIPKFGTAKPYNKTSIIAPTGRAWDTFGAGTHVDLHKFTVPGIYGTLFGTTLIKNMLQRVTPIPAVQTKWGTQWLSNKIRRVNQYYTLVWMEQPDGSYGYSYPVHTKWGTARAGHKHIKPAGLKATKWGTTWVAGTQLIKPFGVFDVFMGNKHDVSSTIRDITPYWTDLGQFGEPSMSPLYVRTKGENETLFPYGWPRVGGTHVMNVSAGSRQRFGTPFASFTPRYVEPPSIKLNTRFGTPPWGVMHTYTQFIRPPLLLAERWGREDWDYRPGLTVIYREKLRAVGIVSGGFGMARAVDGDRYRWENTRLSKVGFTQ